MTLLVDNVLDPLRRLYGRPITVSSGYRSPELNKAVRGAANSHHVRGMAADISGGSPAENKKLYDLIAAHLPYTQLIDEYGLSWVHVSYETGNLKKQNLKIR